MKGRRNISAESGSIHQCLDIVTGTSAQDTHSGHTSGRECVLDGGAPASLVVYFAFGYFPSTFFCLLPLSPPPPPTPPPDDSCLTALNDGPCD